MAWNFLWSQDSPRELRSQVYDLIVWHQKIFHIMDHPDPRIDVVKFSTLGSWRELLAVAEADARGRISKYVKNTLDNLEITRMLVEELDCLDKPWPFKSNEARVNFLRSAQPADALFYDPPAAEGSRVIVLSGLPGSGKDTYAQRAFPDIPAISLDATRARLKIKPGENDGAAIQAAYEEARVQLRARTPFIWNATNLTRLFRDKIIGLSLSYDAYVEIHALDRTPQVI